jgi:hypothetical protein
VWTVRTVGTVWTVKTVAGIVGTVKTGGTVWTVRTLGTVDCSLQLLAALLAVSGVDKSHRPV